MVAVINRPEECDPGGVRKLLHLLSSLCDSPAGSVIYRQVEGMLDEIATNHLKSELAYYGFVNVLLDAFASHLAPGSPRYVQVRLLQARLQPPLTVSELTTLGEFVNQCADSMRTSRSFETSALTQAISPLLRAFGIEDALHSVPAGEVPVPPECEPARDEPAASVTELHHTAQSADAIDLAPGGADAGDVAEDEYKAEHKHEHEDEDEGDDDLAETMPSGRELREAGRAGLEARREDVQKLQTTLGQQVVETITQNEEFGALLEVVMAGLRQADDVKGVENARWTMIREIEKLMKGHDELAEKLDSTHHYMQLIESDSRELTDELTRVRLLSLTDELTGLPNRRAFMRRLEDEVARVQRYGLPLSFALMDLDHFKEINDEYGHAAGDEVLRVYAKNILSVFRHHDMVARYGGEEFAVLLPNTDSDGAIRALNKVKRRAAETRWQSNGTVSQVPLFSAGVALFKSGESASAFIERADKALYRAKRLGRDRVELDITYETEQGGRDERRRSTDL